MGGGDHTRQQNVPKKPRNYSADQVVVGASGAGGFDKAMIGSCLFSFRSEIPLTAVGLAKGTKFMMMANGDHEGLQLMSGGRRIAVYTGERVDQLKQCMAGGYIYEGVINSMTGMVADCTVTGKAPV